MDRELVQSSVPPPSFQIWTISSTKTVTPPSQLHTLDPLHSTSKPTTVNRESLTQFLLKDNRIGTVEITIPAGSVGPPAHWHEMHDETFYVIQGTVRFHAPNGKIVDAKSGDYVTVPTRAPHTFSNPFDQEAKFINTLTPAFYVNYFKLLAEVSVKDKKMMKEKNLECMARYATVPAKELIQAIERGEN